MSIFDIGGDAPYKAISPLPLNVRKRIFCFQRKLVLFTSRSGECGCAGSHTRGTCTLAIGMPALRARSGYFVKGIPVPRWRYLERGTRFFMPLERVAVTQARQRKADAEDGRKSRKGQSRNRRLWICRRCFEDLAGGKQLRRLRGVCQRSAKGAE